MSTQPLPQPDPITQMVQDPDFAKMPLAEQRKALAAHDPMFQQAGDFAIGQFVQAHQPAVPQVAAVPQQGAVRRFLTRALDLPDDIVERPGAYLNPFSKEYRQADAEMRARDVAAAQPGGSIAPQQFPMPGRQTFADIKAGNYAGALGDVLPDAYAAASAAAPIAGRALQTPTAARVVPQAGRYLGMAAGYEAGKVVGHPAIGAATGAGVGEVAGRGLLKAGPALSRSVGIVQDPLAVQNPALPQEIAPTAKPTVDDLLQNVKDAIDKRFGKQDWDTNAPKPQASDNIIDQLTKSILQAKKAKLIK